jgi:small conductance mechanosensitive channel
MVEFYMSLAMALTVENLPDILQNFADILFQRSLLSVVLHALWALVILMVTRWLATFSGRLTRTFFARFQVVIQPTLQKFLVQATGIMIWVVGLVAALNIIGIQTTTIVAVIGAAGLAVGLALQNSLSHFAAGVLLISFRPFEVGDRIEGAGVAGMVDAIGLFSTTVITADNVRITVPNGNLFSSNLQNKTVMGTRRVDLEINIGNQPIAPTITTLLSLVQPHPLVLDQPQTECQMGAITPEGATILYLRPWCNADHYDQVRSEVLQLARETLQENQVEGI